MRDGRGHGAILHVAEAGDEAVDHGAGAAMALDQRDLADVVVAVHRHQPVLDRRSASSARVGAWFSMTPITRTRTSLAPFGEAMSKSLAFSFLPSFIVFLALCRIGVGRDVGLELACLGEPDAARVDLVDDERRQVGDDEEIGEPPRRDRADLALQPEMLRRC